MADTPRDRESQAARAPPPASARGRATSKRQLANRIQEERDNNTHENNIYSYYTRFFFYTKVRFQKANDEGASTCC
jgi:hypothetical protein